MNLPGFEKRPLVIALDLDGTLFNSRSELTRRNKEAVLACVKEGIPVIIATARSERSTRLLIGQELETLCSLVVMNGSIVKAALPLSGIFKEKFAHGVAEAVIGFVLEKVPDIRITIEIEGYEFGANWRVDPELLWKVNAATPEMVLTVEEALERNPSKMAVSDMGRDLSILSLAITQRFKGSVSVFPSNNNTFLNIVNPRVSKSSAIRKLLGSCNIDMGDLMAFGDDAPDLDMLSECGISVAMANAIPEVKSECKYQTLSNDEDGVAIVLEKLLQ